MCRIQEGVYFQNKDLLLGHLSAEEKNGMNGVCAQTWGTPTVAKPPSQQDQLLFPLLQQQPLSKQDSLTSSPEPHKGWL